MRFRARLMLSLLALATIPLLALGLAVRSEMRARVEREGERRQHAVSSSIETRLLRESAAARQRIGALGAELVRDDRFRTALADDGSPDRRWLRDWASTAMASSGFDVLQLQDSGGRILSSGHFRNDFDREAPSMVAYEQRGAVWDARTPDGLRRVLAVTDSLRVRGTLLTLTGGARFDSAHVASLSPDGTVSSLLLPLDAPIPGHALTPDTLAYLRDESGAPAGWLQLVLIADIELASALQADVTRWLVLILGATLLLALGLAVVLGRYAAAPLADLSTRTEKLDLDRLDQRFSTGRADELGVLERTLDALTARLRTSAARLRDAERAAATGDLARQVNHDIKNGLAPIRNVLRHLGQVAEQEPAALAPIFLERRGTLESSVEYLDALARNYARLSPSLSHGPTDAGAVMREVASGVTAATVTVDVAPALPSVRADAVVLHRILDNLVSNAVDALEGKPGSVTLGAVPVTVGGEDRVRFTVADTGRGMTRDELNRAFDDFHTTKVGGTGLGLSVVRRLLTDVGGSVRAETAPGEGTTFTVEIPAARFPA